MVIHELTGLAFYRTLCFERVIQKSEKSENKGTTTAEGEAPLIW
ncbi:MAG TPA: hypothetical protein VKA87_00580 [Nitrososphaeraceae archaeon]|nr:hypothetical protein [Nitrososphaeraceae archaeon]